jgi:DNA-binding transcriptional regulator YdaS (Cro superfamily)
MTLSDFLKAEGNSASKLADLLGVAVSTVTRAAKGDLLPSKQLMEGIYRATDGKVTPNDFFGIGVCPENPRPDVQEIQAT